jgi:hypothetical protein
MNPSNEFGFDIENSLCVKKWLTQWTKDVRHTTDIEKLIELFKDHYINDWMFGEYFGKSKRPIRPFFDLDWKGDEAEGRSLITRAKERILKDFGISKAQLIGTVATSPHKTITEHWFAQGLKTTLVDLIHWHNSLPDDLKKIIDDKPYGSGALRHHSCHKIKYNPSSGKSDDGDTYVEDDKFIDYDGNDLRGIYYVEGKDDEVVFISTVINKTFVQYTKDDFKTFTWEAPKPAKKAKTPIVSDTESDMGDAEPTKVDFTHLDKTKYGETLQRIIDITKGFPYDTKRNCEYLADVVKWNIWTEVIVNCAKEDNENRTDEYRAVWDTISRQFDGYDENKNSMYWDKCFKKRTKSKYSIADISKWSRSQHKDTENDRSYEKVKIEFEKSFFVVLEGVKFAHIMTNDDGTKSIQILTKEQLLTLTSPWIYIDKIPKFDKEGNLLEMVDKEYDFTLEWIKDTKRKEHRRIEFDPDPNWKSVNNAYNAWCGFPVETVKTEPSTERKAEIDTILATYFDAMCSGDKAVEKYLLDWTADFVQNPHRTCEVALVFYSEDEGVGKSSFGLLCSSIIGDPKMARFGFMQNGFTQIDKKFNADLANAMLVMCDEVKVADGFEKADTIKNTITKPSISIEPKCKDATTIRHKIRYIFTSNNFKMVDVGKDGRRFCPIEVSTRLKGNNAFWAKFQEMRNNMEDMAYVYKTFMARDISHWIGLNDICKAQKYIPETNYKKELKEINKPHLINFIETECEWLIARSVVSATDLMKHFIRWMEKHRYSTERINSTSFGLMFRTHKDICDEMFEKTRTTQGVDYHINKQAIIDYMKTTCDIELTDVEPIQGNLPEKDL